MGFKNDSVYRTRRILCLVIFVLLLSIIVVLHIARLPRNMCKPRRFARPGERKAVRTAACGHGYARIANGTCSDG